MLATGSWPGSPTEAPSERNHGEPVGAKPRGQASMDHGESVAQILPNSRRRLQRLDYDLCGRPTHASAMARTQNRLLAQSTPSSPMRQTLFPRPALIIRHIALGLREKAHARAPSPCLAAPENLTPGPSPGPSPQAERGVCGSRDTGAAPPLSASGPRADRGVWRAPASVVATGRYGHVNRSASPPQCEPARCRCRAGPVLRKRTPRSLAATHTRPKHSLGDGWLAPHRPGQWL